jgi:hypothetical protein
MNIANTIFALFFDFHYTVYQAITFGCFKGVGQIALSYLAPCLPCLSSGRRRQAFARGRKMYLRQF